MNHQRKRRHVEIPLIVQNNLKYVKNVTMHTTCADVINMVLKKTENSENQSEAFGIYECSRGIERLLPAKSRLLKIMRRWEADEEYKLEFRKVNPTISTLARADDIRRKLMERQQRLHSRPLTLSRNSNNVLENIPTKLCLNYECKHHTSKINSYTNTNVKDFVSSEARNNNLLSDTDDNTAFRKQSDNVGLVHIKETAFNYNVNEIKFAKRKTLKTKLGNETNMKKSTPKTHYDKDKHHNLRRHEKFADHVIDKVSRIHKKKGKEALLKKYFADYITYQTNSNLDTEYRERGDGADSSPEISSEYKDFPESRDLYDISDDVKNGKLSDLDTAFVLDSSDDDAETRVSYNVPNVSPTDDFIKPEQNVSHSIDFGENLKQNARCHRNRLVEYSFSDEDFDLNKSDDVANDNDVMGYVSSDSDVVKSIFSENNKSTDEDVEMESFMHSKLYHEFSNESLSALPSDDEEEILV